MVVRVCLEVVDIDSGQARDEQLQLLLIEYGDELLGDDLIEAFQEAVYLGLDRLSHLHVACSLDILPLVGLRYWDVLPVWLQLLHHRLPKLLHLHSTK